MYREITNELLLNKINELYENRDHYIDNMKKSEQGNACKQIIELIKETAK